MTLDFTGTVSDISDEGVLDGSVSLGTPFHLHVVYDESAPVSDVSGNQFDWIFLVPPSEASATVGGYSAATGPLGGDPTLPLGFQVILFNEPDGGSDSYMVSAGGPVSGGAGPLSSTFGVLLYDSTGTALDSSELSNVNFAIAAWDSHALSLVLRDESSGLEAGVSAQLEQVAVSRVPEPASAALPMAGLAALSAAAARVRR